MTRWCECGLPKRMDAEACPRCLALDGWTVPQARLIRAMQGAAGFVSQVYLEAVTGIARRNVQAALADLLQRGIVTRYQDAPDAVAVFILNPKRISPMKKQTEIPGTERPVIEALENVAVSYVAIRDERIAMNKEEKTAKQELQAEIEQHMESLERDANGNPVYTWYDGERELELKYEKKTTVNVSVRVKKADDESEGESADVIDLEKEAAAVG